MPKKSRELKSMLLQVGFSWKPAKGSHSKWIHPKLVNDLTPYPSPVGEG